jgi:hypothetical protein
MLAQGDPDMILKNDCDGICPLQAAVTCHPESEVYNILLGFLSRHADLTPFHTPEFGRLCRALGRENLIAKAVMDRVAFPYAE